MTNSNSRLSLWRILSNLFVALVGAYGLSVAGFLLLRSIFGDNTWLLALFNSFAHLLFVPAVILIPVCLLLRRVRVIVLLLPALVAFILTYVPMFVPHAPRAVAADAPQLTVVTYNLKAQTADLEPLISVIRESGADIIALQELSEPAAAGIAASLQDVYPYQALHPQPEPAFTGQGLLSSYPIESDDYWVIHYGHQRAEIDVDGQMLIAYNSHPTPPFYTYDWRISGHTQRAEDVASVLSRLQTEAPDVPLILAGDLNMTDQSSDYWRIATLLTDTHREIGWGMGFSFPNFSVLSPRLAFLPPVARIDYVFHNSRLRGVETHILPETGGSDHHPVYTVLTFEPVETAN